MKVKNIGNIIKYSKKPDPLKKAYLKSLNLYAPPFLIKYYKRKYDGNKYKYHNLEKNLKACRIPVTLAKYMAISAFYPLILLPGFLLLGLLLGQALAEPIYNLNLISGTVLPSYLEGQKLLLIEFLMVSATTLLLAYLTRFLILYYPRIYASQRKQNIEVIFPHMVNMMLGMAKGGTPVLKILRVISEEKNVTGEAGEEMGAIVTKVEIFHKDLVKSIREVAQTTPSEVFSDFLDDLVSILEGSGKVGEFLEYKSKHLLDEKEKYQGLFLNTLGVMAEVYVSILVVAPLFLIIIFVVMGMLGEVNQKLMTLIIYLYMPVGGIMFMLMISSMMRGFEVEWIGERVHKFPVSARVVKEQEKEFTYKSKFKQTTNKLLRGMRSITSDLHIFISKPEYTFYITIPLSVVSIPFIIGWKVETILIYLLVLNALPYTILAELRKRRIRKIEERIPDFLKQLASLNESGLNIVVAVRMLSSSNLGVLTKEIIKVRKDLEWGMLLPHALKRFETRAGSATVTQVTSILLRAMEASGTVKDALFTAARDAQLYMRLRQNVKNEMFVYVLVIYMTFGVFLFTILILSKNFLEVLPSSSSFQEFSGAQFNVPNVEELNRLFYHTSLINGAVGGFVAGLMGEGEMKSGLKHAIIMVSVAFIAFKFFS
ncbi:MAG: type II secretion system F family protein [Archaeoglobaceae archaeon]